VVIDVGGLSATEIDRRRYDRTVENMSRMDAPLTPPAVDKDASGKYVVFGAATWARGPARDDTR
jgi:hypothetical protein